MKNIEQKKNKNKIHTTRSADQVICKPLSLNEVISRR